MTNAVAYYRMSSDRQETSIPDQRDAVHDYAKKHNLTIIRQYQDEGISGDATEKRHEFQRMLQEATELRDFEVVLCWDQDRFGRFDPLEAGYWVKPLRDEGIRLETVAQGRIDWNDFAGRIIFAVRQEGKYAFLQDLSRNTLRGKIRGAREATWPGGPPPFGYGLANKKLVLGDPAAVDFVQWLFRRYTEPGVSLRVLVDEANKKGLRAPRGGLWRINTLRRILGCPLYTGDFVWNRLHAGKYHGIERGALVKRNGRRKPSTAITNKPEDHIVVPNAHEALVDHEAWNAVQKKLADNCRQTSPHRGTGQYLLSGLVKCANCGSPMHGECDRRRPTGPYRRYVCAGHTSSGEAKCFRMRIAEDSLVRCLVRLIRREFLNPENIKKLEAEIERQLQERNKPPSRRTRQRMKRRLASLDDKIERGAEQLLAAPPELTDVLTKKLRDWQDERAKLQLEFDGLPTGDEQTTPIDRTTVARTIDKLWTLEEQIRSADRALLGATLQQLVAKIECRFSRQKHGSRTVRRLESGVIYLRPQGQELFPTSSRWEQLSSIRFHRRDLEACA